jgi:hypothetical protein
VVVDHGVTAPTGPPPDQPSLRSRPAR